MARRLLSPPSMASGKRLVLCASLWAVVGCQATGLVTDRSPRGPAKPDGDAADPSPRTPCGEAAIAAHVTLEGYCAPCHGGGSAARGGFDYVLDHARLLSTGKVVPFEPEMSPIYLRPRNGEMPPAGVPSRPDDGEIETIGRWIACGAPPFDGSVPPDPDGDGPDPMLPPGGTPPPGGVISLDEMIATMLQDVRDFDRTDRQRIRYITLAHLYNAGASEAELEVYRAGLSLLVNSLSGGALVVRPEPIDARRTIYRIDLRDYAWELDTWERIIARYPYLVVYDEDSSLYPIDEDAAQRLRDETQTVVPWALADWLVYEGSQAPLYYDVLQLPRTLFELEDELGIDISDDIATEQVDRAGFNLSGVSVSNRVIERHELPGRRGAFWISYDFRNSRDERNIFNHPLDFAPDGGEVIFTLPNDLQGYYITNATGQRLDQAPNDIVADPRTPDHAVLSGLSCMGCHHGQGIIPKDDEIRDYALATFAGGRFLEAVLELYPPAEDFRALQAGDGERFLAARRAAADDVDAPEPVVHVYEDHDAPLTLQRVATTLGVTPEDLERALSTDARAFPAEVAALRSAGATIHRDVFEDVFADTVCALGLGQPCFIDIDDRTFCFCDF